MTRAECACAGSVNVGKGKQGVGLCADVQRMKSNQPLLLGRQIPEARQRSRIYGTVICA